MQVYTLNIGNTNESWDDYNGCLYTLSIYRTGFASILTDKYCMPFVTVFHI